MAYVPVPACQGGYRVLDKRSAICEHYYLVRVISCKALPDFAAKHPDAAGPLDNWYRRTKKANWSNLSEVRTDYPHADLVGTCTVFNIKGNAYHLVTKIFYRQKKVLIRFVLTHKDYDREGWKDDCRS
jgi:mRNA interferase HigB